VLPRPFTSLTELSRQLDAAQLHGCVAQLGIVAHGIRGESLDPGVIHLNPTLSAASLQRDPRIAAELASIGRAFLQPAAQVTLYACAAGGGPQGTALLTALSRIWSGRTVVGFVTYGDVSSGGMSAALAAGNVTDTLTGVPTSAPPGAPRLGPGRASAKQAYEGLIVQWPDLPALWRTYSRLRPLEVRRLTREGQRLTPPQSALHMYVTRTLAPDPDNPSYQRSIYPEAQPSEGEQTGPPGR